MQTHRYKSIYNLAVLLAGLIAASFGKADAEIHLPLEQAASGNFYIHARLSEHIETNLLLDTGSGYVSLSKATFKKINAEQTTTFQRNIYGKLANGRSMEVPIYMIERLQLADNCILSNIEVAVFPNADRDILGLNALAHLQPFTMQMDPPLLTGAQCI